MELKEFTKELYEFADEVNDAARRQLGSRKIGKNRSYGVATRTLQKSLTYSISKGKIVFESPQPYAAFIHWGVNGTRKRRGAPFSFKYDNPSEKHVDAIYQWMKDKPVRLRTAGGQFRSQQPYQSERTGKIVDPKRSVAYAIAKSIKRKGIVGLRYYIVALETIVPQYRDKLGSALIDDFLSAFKFKTDNITIAPK